MYNCDETDFGRSSSPEFLSESEDIPDSFEYIRNESRTDNFSSACPFIFRVSRAPLSEYLESGGSFAESVEASPLNISEKKYAAESQKVSAVTGMTKGPEAEHGIPGALNINSRTSEFNGKLSKEDVEGNSCNTSSEAILGRLIQDSENILQTTPQLNPPKINNFETVKRSGNEIKISSEDGSKMAEDCINEDPAQNTNRFEERNELFPRHPQNLTKKIIFDLFLVIFMMFAIRSSIIPALFSEFMSPNPAWAPFSLGFICAVLCCGLLYFFCESK